MRALRHACILLTLALAIGGCVKFKQVWTVNPDGSGKVTQTFGFSERALQEAPKDPFDNLDNPEELIDSEDEGFVAFTRPQIRTEGGYKYATFTAYFENINNVTLSGDAGNGEMEATHYQLKDGTFTVSDGMLGQIITTIDNDAQYRDPTYRPVFLDMMEGMEFGESYDLPGKITDAQGYTADGDVARTTVTIKELLGDPNAKLNKLKDNKQTITFTPTGWQGGEAAWKAELAAAKAEWAAMKNNTPASAGTE
ncbi:MAG: hypothetical protein AAF333_06130 [Planctomycetota bacterium]